MLHGLLTVCVYGCMIVLYSCMQLCFICVPCQWAHYIGSAVIYLSCPGYITIRTIQLYFDMLV
nr:MAG TPA: hypothetical protein [Caudoviricetes sp.]DAV70205.1 MAG TPA: hypothetical protein [Caudoviricetes sp.]